MSEPQTRVFSWCQTHGQPDQYHNLCRHTFTSEIGVTWTCSCPNHTENNEENNE